MTIERTEGILPDEVQVKIKILLADDHPIFRQGIRGLLERQQDFQVVAEAGDGEAAIRLAAEFNPDVVLIDIGMPLLNGLEATRRLKAENPGIAVLVLTIHEDEEYLFGLLEAGAAGYLLKSADGAELVQAIRAVRYGEHVLHPTVLQRLLKSAARRQFKPIRLGNVEELSPREVQVLQLAARGIGNKQIANEMSLGVRTVKGHMASIFAKMGVASRTEAVLTALKRGWIVIEDVDYGGG
ncbi:MAG: response regulator transcription factor [Dehalococcoidia bacterium]